MVKLDACSGKCTCMQDWTKLAVDLREDAKIANKHTTRNQCASPFKFV